ncbi:MAG: hypothetical protein ACP5C4_05665 [Methanomicrobiales archaeon]
MKRILILALAAMLLVPGVLAFQGQNGAGPGSQAGPQNEESADGSPADSSPPGQPGGPPGNGAGQPDGDQSPPGGGPPEHVQERRQVHERLQEEIRLRQENLTMEEPAGHHNAVRVAVHAFLALGEMDGGIGRNISLIARQFNNSVQASIRAEERIQERNQFMTLLFGGDRGAAGTLLQETRENQQRIRQMDELIATCTCTNETRAILREELQTIEQEQARLRGLALQEQNQTGLFGWLWR